MRSSAALVAILLTACAATPEQDSLVWSDAVVRTMEREQGDVVEVANFSRLRPGDSPEPWVPWLLVRGNAPTKYQVAEVDGVVALAAEGVEGGSGMWRKLRVDPQHNPVMEWRWRVPQPAPEHADVGRREMPH